MSKKLKNINETDYTSVGTTFYDDMYAGGKGRYALSANQLWSGFIEPWLNVLKIAKLEAQKTLANLLTFFKVLTSFNRQKLQNIMDKHKDRIKSLDDKSQALLDAMPVDSTVAFAAFLFNPGAYLASKSNVTGTVKSVANFFKEAGFGDFTPGELESVDTNTISRARKREQSGLISKALRGLNSLFMAGYEPEGSILVEQDKTEDKDSSLPIEERDYSGIQMTEEGFNEIIKSGGGLPGLEKVKNEMLADSENFLSMSRTAAELIEFISGISEIANLDEYVEFIEKLGQINPESGMPSRSEIESALDKDVKEISSKKDAEEETAKIILQKRGIEDPTEEEIKSVTSEEKRQEIQSVAFGNILARLKASALNSAKEIYKNHIEIYDNLYPEDADESSMSIINNTEYGQNLKSAKNLLDSANSSIENTEI
jgi:hypothetical protein